MVELINGHDENIKIGQRVMVGGNYRGTVQYIGPVPPNAGKWVGVDWDDPTRGKHDGVYEGVRYFTAFRPTSGSFVRKEKLNFGKSCPEAIERKYGDNNITPNEEQMLELKKAINAPFLEMVGFDSVSEKLRSFESLTIVILRENEVSNAGEPLKLKTMFPLIQELDLSINLLSSWYDVVDISKQLEDLRILALSENKIMVPNDNEIEELKKQNPFRSLQNMVLANMKYSWNEIIQCAKLWPHVENLQIQYNKVSILDLPETPVFEQLTQLDLEGNPLEKWEEVNKLGILPRLEFLNLNRTGISKVTIPSNDIFKSLKTLLLSHNCISTWSDINDLNKINLISFKFMNNPVLKDCPITLSYQLIIAKIHSLEVLNGQFITRDDRRGAEYDYIKRYGEEWNKCKNDDVLLSQFIKEHSCYTNLIKKYGEAEPSEYAIISTKLKTSLLKLEIVAEPTGQVIEKSLPRTMLVQRLVGLVQKLFNTGSLRPILYFISYKKPESKFLMENHLKNIDFYGVEDGDKIIVEW